MWLMAERHVRSLMADGGGARVRVLYCRVRRPWMLWRRQRERAGCVGVCSSCGSRLSRKKKNDLDQTYSRDARDSTGKARLDLVSKQGRRGARFGSGNVAASRQEQTCAAGQDSAELSVFSREAAAGWWWWQQRWAALRRGGGSRERRRSGRASEPLFAESFVLQLGYRFDRCAMAIA
jgi:hypothetical protein